MKKRKRVRNTAIIAVVIVVALMAAGVYALITAQSSVTNVFTSGDVIVEATIEGGSDSTTISPGEAKSFKVSAKNIGKNAAYVRVQVVPTILDKDGDVIETLPADSINYLNLGENWPSVDADGYFYYGKALEPNEETSDVFTGFEFVQNASEYSSDGRQFELKVYVSAVQSAHNGSSAREASGWPEVTE